MEKWSLKNKICVITGSTSGLGLETTKKLRDVGAKLVLLVRNESRKQQMLDEFPSADYFFVDFSDLKAMYQVAQKIRDTYPEIHLLKNNAGIISFDKLTLNQDGTETTIAINYLSHFILTETLLPNLKMEDETRIVSTGSIIHRKALLNFDDLYHSKNYGPMKMYATSKLMLVMYSHFLGQRLKDTNIHTHCVDPGAVATQISRSRGKFFNALFSIGKVFLTSIEKGSRTNIYGCLSPEISNLTSTYLIKAKVKKANDRALDQNKWQQLETWTKSELEKLDIHLNH